MTSLRDPNIPILIVDDSAQYVQVLKMILKNAFGYSNISSCERTAQAMELIAGDPTKFKLLFIDFRFPEGDTGGDLLQKLQSQELLKDKVAFLITSEPSVENVKQAAKAGAAGVVAKPFDREQLKKQIEKAERWLVTVAGESF